MPETIHTTNTKATHKLCEDLAPLLEATALPYEYEKQALYYPRPCKLKLGTSIQGVCPTIMIRVIANKPTHVIVYGEWPYSDILERAFSPYRTDGKSITSSRMKPVERIARQIQTRFLPAYLQEFENCMTQMKGEEQRHLKELSYAKVLADKLSVDVNKRWPKRVEHSVEGKQVFFSVSGDSCEIRISCDMNTASQVATMWKILTEPAEKERDQANDGDTTRE